MIKINRSTSYADKIRAYKIILDNECLGEIKRKETREFEVTEGKHTIYLKIDWCKSNKIEFYASSDEVIEFDCGISISGWRTLLSFIYITFLKNKYLWIKMKNKVIL